MKRLIPRLRHRRRILAWPVAGLVVLALLAGPVTPASATAAGSAAPDRTAPTATHTVTLLTGDVVRVFDVGGGKQAADIVRPHGALGGVHTQTVGKDLYVLPDEVMPYLAAGAVDRRLFDVSALIRQGYDDAHSDGIPLILGYTGSGAAQAAPPAGTSAVRALPSIHGRALKAGKKRARDVWKSLAPNGPVAGTTALGTGLAKVWLDAREHADLAQSTAQIGAPAAWAAGYDGTGVKVAVLDTGADLNHPDLAGRVSQAVSFVPGQDAGDGNGHGTHTAVDGGRQWHRVRWPGTGRRARRRPARRQGARERGLRRGLLDHRGHGVGRRPGRHA